MKKNNKVSNPQDEEEDGEFSKTSFSKNYFTYFFHLSPTHKLCFLSCRPFVVNATFLTGIVSYVSWLVQLAVGVHQCMKHDI